jgi:hypothetical protein
MNNISNQEKGCCGQEKDSLPCGTEADLQPVSISPVEDIACCGPSIQQDDNPFGRAGYELCHYVEGFLNTPSGPVPKVMTDLKRVDIIGTILTRIGIGRNNYKISPGLYCVGNPGLDSPVFVTANYKLSFDALRKELTGVDAWILIVNTNSVNVWCAAGKGTFSSAEVVNRVKLTGLDNVVRHKTLVLPQLAATGVSAIQVEKDCGFKVNWGPVRARDIKAFLKRENRVETSMRQVTFSTRERMVLVPVELSFLPKPTLWILLAFFILSGIGTNIFSFHASWSRGLMAAAAYAAGIFAGTVVVPLLLPWIPGRAFSFKGVITGLLAGAGIVAAFWGKIETLEALALLICTAVVSSYLAMNFTGATPFTSPSGVEKEMRTAIPLQVAALLITIVTWVGSAFMKVT